MAVQLDEEDDRGSVPRIPGSPTRELGAAPVGGGPVGTDLEGAGARRARESRSRIVASVIPTPPFAQPSAGVGHRPEGHGAAGERGPKDLTNQLHPDHIIFILV